ncbi:MAG: xylan 1,4-beta-xylosidase [Acidobacteria bacterium]|nr:MAG: xylan 1,4-beta-xylosidase [Acidobacteriota bacterium]
MLNRFSGFALPILISVCLICASAQSAPESSENRGYRNPILFSDYSDPDVIRNGDHFYMVASSFHFVPGIPILESLDLVHWKILGHALPRLDIDARYDLIGSNGYGMGVWAPAIRKHNGLFYIYFPTPTEGIFVVTAKTINGPWSKPLPLIRQPGLEDPCPFWDEDASAYLVHSKKGAGPLILRRMAADGLSVLDDGKEIVRDPEHLPTLEGPKIYKREGYYYIFAPFGGVERGSQAVLRSKSIWGPYEYRTVLAQGSTKINGPHQGAYVETPDGRGWFVHFQSRGAHGRIVHLQPVKWQDGWPLMGEVVPGGSVGEPIAEYPQLPVEADAKGRAMQPQTSDEFDAPTLGPQWEWNHNPDDARWSLSQRHGFLRLVPGAASGFLRARNTLTQQMQSESLEFTVRMDVSHMQIGVRAGVAMLQKNPNGLQVVQEAGKRKLQLFTANDVSDGPELKVNTVQVRINIDGDRAIYSYSLDDGRSFHQLGNDISITFSFWKGSRPALFAYKATSIHQGAQSKLNSDKDGAIDFDWAHYRALP